MKIAVAAAAADLSGGTAISTLIGGLVDRVPTLVAASTSTGEEAMWAPDLAGVVYTTDDVHERIAVAAQRLDTMASDLAAAAALESDLIKQRQKLGFVIRMRRAAATLRGPGLPPSVLKVSSPTSVSVAMTNPPTTRMRLSFDRIDARGHLEVEWDPAIDEGLVRTVLVGTGTWAVSPSIEPTFVQQGDGSIVIAARFERLRAATTGGPFVLTATHTALVADSGPARTTADQRAMSGWPQPTLTLRCEASAPTMDSLTFPSSPAGSGDVRTIGSAPTIVTETLALLAEIAVERARAGAMSMIKERFVDPACVDPNDRITLRKLGVSSSDALAFPRSCELLQQLRLTDVLNSGEALLLALRDDTRFTIAPAVVSRVGGDRFAPALQAALELVNRAIEQGSFDGLDGQVVLSVLTRLDLLGAIVPTLQPAVLRPTLQAAFDASAALLAAMCNSDEASAACAARLLPDGVNAVELLAVVRTAAKRSLVSEPFWTLVVADLATMLPTVRLTLPPGLAPAIEAALNKMDATIRKQICEDGEEVAACATRWVTHPQQLARWASLIAQTSRPEIAKALLAAAPTAIHAHLNDGLGYACGIRLAIAVTKNCADGHCSADQIEQMLIKPGDYFGVDKAWPYGMCWDGATYVAAPQKLATLQRHVLDGIALVQPVRDARGRERAVAALRLTFEILRKLEPSEDVTLEKFEDVAVALVEERYDAALVGTIRLVKALRPAGTVEIPEGLEKLANLVGAVASYARVYRDTKGGDPAAAREARKQALESLIDAATDRRGRGDQHVLSIGSNVGLSATWTRRWGEEGSFEPSLRVPFGLAIERLPSDEDGLLGFAGWRIGLQLADLGQFVTVGEDEKLDDVHWSTFVSPGLEAAVLLGESHRAVNVTFHASYAPALGVEENGTRHEGVWRYGVSLGYYVPFFDLN